MDNEGRIERMKFLIYKPKNTIYLNLGTLNYCGMEYTIYSDTSSGDIYFRVSSDFEKFETLLDFKQEFVEPPKSGVAEGKIKINGEWQDCQWDIDMNKLQVHL